MRDQGLLQHFQTEISSAAELEQKGQGIEAFKKLERAHVIGQSRTWTHVKVHWLMLSFAIRNLDLREIWGQVIRIVGAATKTPFGIYPKGNTGGSNVWFFKPMPIPEDLKEILDQTNAN